MVKLPNRIHRINRVHRSLGVDIGGVIIDRANDKTDTSFFSENYLLTTPVPGALESLAYLASNFFPAVYLISKCGPQIEAKTRDWLKHHDFFRKTSIPPENLHFCRERKNKAVICHNLGISHFIDDRLEVLSCLDQVPNLYLFKPNPDEIKRYEIHLEKVTRIESWEDLLKKIIPLSEAEARFIQNQHQTRIGY